MEKVFKLLWLINTCTKSLRQYLEIEPIKDVRVFFAKEKPIGIVIIYEDPVKKDTLVHFSKKFNYDRFIPDDRYMSNCQFFYWEEGKSYDIRFACPHLDNITEEPLFK